MNLMLWVPRAATRADWAAAARAQGHAVSAPATPGAALLALAAGRHGLMLAAADGAQEAETALALMRAAARHQPGLAVVLAAGPATPPAGRLYARAGNLRRVVRAPADAAALARLLGAAPAAMLTAARTSGSAGWPAAPARHSAARLS